MDVRESSFLLEVRNVTRRYALPRESLFKPPAAVDALKGVSLNVTAGRSMGIVGESGSGKSRLAGLVMALAPPSGEILFLGRHLHALPPDELRAARRDFQIVFQDPYGSLDPRLSRSTEASDGKFSDDFKPWEVHLYRLGR